MKKVLVLVLVLILLLAGVGVWFWRAMGPSEAALLVPSETVALVSFPDMHRSSMRWPQTALAQIGIEPEMKAFLEKPLAYLAKARGGDEAAQILLKLKPRRIFVALVNVSAKDVGALLGFQFWGGKGEHDAAIARLREELLRGQAKQDVKTETYEGDEISSITFSKGVLYSAHHGQWGFLSNSLTTLQGALDRAAGRAKSPSLAENASFKETAAELLGEPDFLLFLQPQPVLDTLLAIGQALGQQSIPSQVEQIKKVEAIGATAKLDGANMHDRIFVLRRDPPNVGSLSHEAIKVTSADTTIYFDFLTNLGELTKLQSNPAMAIVAAKYPILNSPLLQMIPEAFGSEGAISLYWPLGSMKPEAFFALKVKDEAKANQALQAFIANFPEATITENEDQKFYNFPSMRSMFLNPTLTLTKGFLIAGLDNADVERAVKAERKGLTLDNSKSFALALPSYHAANQAFGYIDIRQIFERIYPKARDILQFSGALGGSEYLDTTKMPSTDTIAKHLDPIVYSQSRLSNGYLVESSGPLTLNQIILLGAGAGNALRPGSSE